MSACQVRETGQVRRRELPGSSPVHIAVMCRTPVMARQTASSSRRSASSCSRCRYAASSASRSRRSEAPGMRAAARRRARTPSAVSGPSPHRFVTAFVAAFATRWPTQLPAASSSNGASVTNRARRRRSRAVTVRFAVENPPRASTDHSPSSRPNADSTTRCGRSCIAWTATSRVLPSSDVIQVRSSAGLAPLTITISAMLTTLPRTTTVRTASPSPGGSTGVPMSPSSAGGASLNRSVTTSRCRRRGDREPR